MLLQSVRVITAVTLPLNLAIPPLVLFILSAGEPAAKKTKVGMLHCYLCYTASLHVLCFFAGLLKHGFGNVISLSPTVFACLLKHGFGNVISLSVSVTLFHNYAVYNKPDQAPRYTLPPSYN